MSNPREELLTAIEVGNTDLVIELLDHGVPMIIQLILIAIRLQRYGILEAFISRGWDINTEVNGSIPSVLM